MDTSAQRCASLRLGQLCSAGLRTHTQNPVNEFYKRDVNKKLHLGRAEKTV